MKGGGEGWLRVVAAEVQAQCTEGMRKCSEAKRAQRRVGLPSLEAQPAQPASGRRASNTACPAAT